MPGETGEVLFLLKKGRVQLYRISVEGKKLVVATLGAGSLFGEMALVGQGMHDTFAEALEECTLCLMSRTDVERLLTSQPRVALRLIEVMDRRLREAEAQLENIAFRSVPSRLAALLLQLAGEGNDGRSLTGYSHQDLAERVGTYRETVTQTLNEFKSKSWVKIGRRQIELLQPEALRAAAEG